MNNTLLVVIQILQIIVLPLFLSYLSNKREITQSQIENVINSSFALNSTYTEIQIKRIEKCDTTRVELFQEFYKHYFEVFHYCNERTNQKIDEWKPLQVELFKQNIVLREKVFLSQIFLGGDFATSLLKLQIGLNDAIFDGNLSSNEYFVPSSLISAVEKQIQSQLKAPVSVEALFSSDNNYEFQQIYKESMEKAKHKL